MIIATSATRLRHHVRLVHTSTNAPIGAVAARLLGVRHGWGLRTVPDGVVVTARMGVADPPAPPRLAVTVTDGVLARLLTFPPAPDLSPYTVLVELTAVEIEQPLHPVPMTLTVALVTPLTGVPSEGRTITARATTGPDPKPTITLPELEPGVYASAPTEWTAAFAPAQLLVDGKLLRTVSMNWQSASTRIRLVDTT